MGQNVPWWWKRFSCVQARVAYALSGVSCQVLFQTQKQVLAKPLDPLRSYIQLHKVHPCPYCQCLCFLKLWSFKVHQEHEFSGLGSGKDWCLSVNPAAEACRSQPTFNCCSCSRVSLFMCINVVCFYPRVSFDEGRSWTKYSFTSTPLFVDGSLVDPGIETQIMT